MPKTRIVGLVGVLSVILAVPAGAAFDRYLPTSSFMEGTAYGVGHQVDYAVYDMVDYATDLTDVSWFDLSEMPEERYVYTYQIFNANAADIWSFTLAGVPEGSISGIAAVGRLDNGSGGVEPDFWWLTVDFTETTWRFDDELVIPDAHSWVLVLTSNHAPVTTTYRVNVPPSGLPGPGAPEPATLLMLGLGAGYLRWRRST